MNIHHLQLFYNVGKDRSMAKAKKSSSVELSTISGQIAELEEDLGTSLFERRPFAFTEAGQILFDFIRPFFEGLPAIKNKIKALIGKRLGVGAAEMVLRHYLAEVVQAVREEFADLEVSQRDGDEATLPELLQRGEIDVAVTVFDKPVSESAVSTTTGEKAETSASSSQPSPPFHGREGAKSKRNEPFCTMPLFKLPLALVVPQKCKWKSAQELWNHGRIEKKIFLLPPQHAVTRHFLEGLAERGIDTFSKEQLETTELIETSVRGGHAVGVTVIMPGVEKIKGVRLLPLTGFTPIMVGLLWRTPATKPMTAFIEKVKAKAKAIQNA